MRALSLVIALVAACHGPRATAPVTLTAPAPPHPEAPAPRVETRPTFVASVVQPTALLVLGDTLVTTDMGRHAFARIPLHGGGEPALVPGVGHYPNRLLADGDGAWIEGCHMGNTVMRVSVDGDHTPLVSSQTVLAIARDDTHVYVVAGNAPNLRRLPRVGRNGRALSPDRSRDLIEPVVHVPGAFDIAVADGQIYLATATSIVAVRVGEAPRRVAALPERPSAIAADSLGVIVGTEGGRVLRVSRDGGAVVELGRVEGGVSSLHLDGCFAFAGGPHGVVAFERSRGVRVPIEEGVVAMAVTVGDERVFFVDYEHASVLSRPRPVCPSADAVGAAHEVTENVTSATSEGAPEDADPLAGRSTSREHTVLVRFGTQEDPVALASASRLVTRVIASRGPELWALATDPQVRALTEHGFDVALRDGVDRLRCVDVRRRPAPTFTPPPPWRAPRAGRAWLVQLAATSSAFESLSDSLAEAGATQLHNEESATLLVEATPAVAMGLRTRVPGVTFVTPYGPWERLLTVASSVSSSDSDAPCVPTPDALLRRLAAWMRAAPASQTDLSLTLFGESREVERLVASLGGAVREGSGTTELVVRVPRRALGPLGDHVDVREISPSGEAAIDGAQ